MTHTSHIRQSTSSGAHTGSFSTEEIKSRIAAMFADVPATTDQR